ncbi:MAG: DUF5131 family protein [Elusimicrobia bacterium]|nr:DUF5131 family protein [Elusimicrobiota bacterium]
MAKETKIAWTDATFNPWRGCVKVSEGCAHCYAESWSKRMGKNIWGKDAKREHASASYWKEPLKWNREAQQTGKPFRVFCASLADVCEDREDLLQPRADLMRLIERTPHLTWLLCTKRPENFEKHFGVRWTPGGWPQNVWAMTTAENQAQADLRIPHLLRVPAVVRGVSYEPALGPVDFKPYMKQLLPVMRERREDECGDANFIHTGEYRTVPGLHWVIVGGESGGGARPFDVAWAQSTIDQCRAAGVAPFVKQLGARPWWNGCTVQWIGVDRYDVNKRVTESALNSENGWSVKLDDPKGGDWAEWPEGLRVREFPR